MARHINIRLVVGTTIGISILIWWVILWFTGTRLILNWAAFKVLPTVFTIDMILVGFFVKWIWKWKILQGWLVPFPDLNGTWQGKIKSLWKSPETGRSPDAVDVILIIKQTFLNISCSIKTAESESVSYSASFLIHGETGQKQLVYSYFNKPKPSVRKRSMPHDGTARLNILTHGERIKLEGEYWTSRETIGEIDLERISGNTE
jgi:hypothetical protein